MSSLDKEDIFPVYFHSLAELSGEDHEDGQILAHNELDLVDYWLLDNVSALVDGGDCKLHNETCLSNTSTITVSPVCQTLFSEFYLWVSVFMSGRRSSLSVWNVRFS